MPFNTYTEGMEQLLKGVNHVHFIGIGGYGMSALAHILINSGYTVSGSDLNENKLTEGLKKSGARVFRGHGAEQVNGADLVIRSTAIPLENAELEAARRLQIPIWHRSELLASIFNHQYGIAIAGAHGKTTTTAMVSLLLEKGALKPTAIIGGEVTFFGSNARLGDGPYVVAEACESDISFLRYRPYLALVTNIEPDHLEYYDGNFSKLVDSYRLFINNVRDGGLAVICGDDPVLQQIRGDLRPNLLSYGFSDHADVKGENVEMKGLSSRFGIRYKNKHLGDIELKVPGRHNILNALGAVAVALFLDVDMSVIRDAFLEFDGAKRRFEIVGSPEDILIVDDYAHHPTEIQATLNAARQSGRKVFCVFQPHRYTRTHFLWDEFIRAFDEADRVVLTDIYSAGEKPIEGVSSRALVQAIQNRGHEHVEVIEEKEKIIQYLLENAKSGDLVITMGAGDIWKTGREFAGRKDKAGEAPG